MIAKLASVLALSILVLVPVAVRAQTPPPAPDGTLIRPFPFPPPGTFSGRVLTRGLRPMPIPMGGGTGGVEARPSAEPAIAPAPGGMILPLPTTPVAGARVEITWALPIFNREEARGGVRRLPPERIWTSTTGPDGSFGFKGLPQGSFKYRVAHPEFATAEGSFQLTGKAGVRQDILVKRSWNRIGSFSGRVTAMPRWRPIPVAKPLDATAKPVDPALAGAEAKDDGAGEPPSAEEAAADALTEPEPGATPPAGADDSKANDSAGTAPGASPVAGLVRPIYLGRPLPGARVEVTSMLPWLSISQATPAAAPGAPEPARTSPLPPVRSWKAETDAGGNFGIKGLPAGRYSYRVTHKYFQPRGGTFFVGEIDPSVVRNIQLERRVRGVFSGVVGEGPRMLLPGDPVLSKDATGSDPAGGNVSPQPGGSGQGQILPFKFQPLPGARVVVMRSWRILWPRPLPTPIPLATNSREPATASTPPPDAADPAKAQADDDAQLLRASEADAPDAVPTEDAADDTVQADAEAAASAPADPKASGANGGAPGLIGPPITIRPPQFRRATTDDRGRFNIGRLPAGTYRFVVRAANHQPQFGGFTLSFRQPRVFRRVLLPVAGGPGPIEPGSLTGVVLGYRFPPDVVFANGGSPDPKTSIVRPVDPVIPLAGATVNLSNIVPPGMGMPSMLQTTTTDERGNFAFKNLGRGRYHLSVDARGYHGSQQEVSMASGSQALKVYLKPAVFGNPPAKPLETPAVSGSDVEDPFKK